MLYWDPDNVAFTIPFIGRPIVWYGVFFAAAFFFGVYILTLVFKKFLSDVGGEGGGERLFAEKASLYVMIGTLVGSRLGHFFFYEKWSEWLSQPWHLLALWDGGLASHGGVIGIMVALPLFLRKMRGKYPFLSLVRLIDLLVIPASFGAAFIRFGNFVNQEILGKATSVPWAVVFGHPAGGGAVLPRHPVQLYEGFAYLAIGAFLASLWFGQRGGVRAGKTAGLFFLCAFTLRFVVEFFKEEQSYIWDGPVTMGALLSIPFILLGGYFLFRGRDSQMERVAEASQ